MKKTVAVFIALFVVSMGTMVGWGFVDQQIKENASPPSGIGPTNTDSNSVSQNTTSNSNSTSSVSNQSKTYTLSDVAQHKTATDCWLVINGNVYNVTSYIDFHPGGADMILMDCGKDATSDYNTQGGRSKGHSARADSQLANYLVGVLQK